MRNSTIWETSLHMSIASVFLNGKDREPHPPLDNPFVSILSLQRISANDRQSAALESNSEVKLFPPMKMKTSTVVYRLYRNDAERRQRDSHFAQPRRLYHLSAIRLT